MARITMCDSEDGQEAVYLVSDLSVAETSAWCAGCFLAMCRAVAAAAPADDAEPAPELDVADPVAAEEGEAAPDPPDPFPGQEEALTASPELTAPSSPFPDLSPDQR